MTLELSFLVTVTSDPREREYVKEKNLREPSIMLVYYNRISGQ